MLIFCLLVYSFMLRKFAYYSSIFTYYSSITLLFLTKNIKKAHNYYTHSSDFHIEALLIKIDSPPVIVFAV